MKRVISLPKILCMLLFIFCVGVGVQSASAATNEVSFIKGDTIVWSYAGGRTIYGATIDVKVKNIAYDKKVTIHGKNVLTGEWFDVQAQYISTLDDGYELWRAYPVSYSKDFEFAIKYEVNGNTYWDNNNGNNYIVTSRTY